LCASRSANFIGRVAELKGLTELLDRVDAARCVG
jgi:hypothetical protein